MPVSEGTRACRGSGSVLGTLLTLSVQGPCEAHVIVPLNG